MQSMFLTTWLGLSIYRIFYLSVQFLYLVNRFGKDKNFGEYIQFVTSIRQIWYYCFDVFWQQLRFLCSLQWTPLYQFAATTWLSWEVYRKEFEISGIFRQPTANVGKEFENRLHCIACITIATILKNQLGIK